MLLQKTIPVVFISKEKLKIALVSLGKNPKVLKSDETGWNQNSIGTTFQEAASQLKTNQIRLLLSNDFIKNKFFVISQALDQANLEAVVTESESTAKARHENPLIGIALKQVSKDKKSHIIPPIQTSNLLEKNSPVVNKKALIIFVTTLILVVLITGGILTSKKALDKPKPSPTPLVITSPEPSPEASPSATPEPEINPADYHMLVLNGTGGKGVAGAVKDILLIKGFKDVIADNADEFNSISTEIQLKKATPESLFKLLNQALSSNYEVTKSADLLTNDSDYDVIITVGELRE